jgi:DNA-binding transcriptional LysR family regulator
MVDLNDFRYFVRIVECGSMTAASRKLNVPKSLSRLLASAP